MDSVTVEAQFRSSKLRHSHALANDLVIASRPGTIPAAGPPVVWAAGAKDPI
jgi:hypothetical protein